MKNMNKAIISHFSKDEIRRLTKIAKEEKIDRSALIRKFVLLKLKEYEIKKMADFYHKEIISLQEAATQAKVSLYEMMDFLKREKITPPVSSDEELETFFLQSRQILENRIDH